jgi:beta-lactamase regulating signal transducer with metallopeptidase domain
MDAILIYFLKANGLLISFYLVYYFLLRKETFFIKSRYFLLFGLFLSIVLPLVNFTKTVWYEPNPIEMESTFSNEIPVSNPVLIKEQIQQTVNWKEIIYSIYAIISLVLLLKIIIELLSFFKFIRIGARSSNANYILIDNPENQNPFSFFNYIVYNSSHFTTAELHHILEHEKIHVLQKHSVDVLLGKLICAIFWMNPIVWLYRKEMLQNLEYIADNFASLKVSNAINYQKTLLKAVINQHQLTITNQFYQSLIKKRIVMLNTQKSNPKKSWKYSILIPILVCFVLVFQVETIAQVKESQTPIEVLNNEEFTSIYNSPYNENPNEKRLIVINGKTYSREELQKRSFGNVQGSGNIIKLTPAEGLAKYGEKGKFGAIEFTGNWKIIHSEIINTTDEKSGDEEEELATSVYENMSDYPIHPTPPTPPNAPIINVDVAAFPKMPQPPKAPTSSPLTNKKEWDKFEQKMAEFEKKMEAIQPEIDAYAEKMANIDEQMKPFEKEMEVFEKKMEIFEKQMDVYSQKVEAYYQGKQKNNK